jgi:hypothetical protein
MRKTFLTTVAAGVVSGVLVAVIMRNLAPSRPSTAFIPTKAKPREYYA